MCTDAARRADHGYCLQCQVDRGIAAAAGARAVVVVGKPPRAASTSARVGSYDGGVRRGVALMGGARLADPALAETIPRGIAHGQHLATGVPLQRPGTSRLKKRGGIGEHSCRGSSRFAASTGHWRYPECAANRTGGARRCSVGALAATLTLRRRPRSTELSPSDRLAIAIGVWLVCGLLLFSAMPHLQARYLEVLAPAVSATLGISIGSLLARRSIALTLATGAVALALLGVHLATDIELIHTKRSDSVLGDPIGPAMGRYLRAHRAGARFEVASAAVFEVTGLVARDGLPVLILNTVDGPRVMSATLESLIRAGQVHFYFSTHGCRGSEHCLTNERWAYNHSKPVLGYSELRRFEALRSVTRPRRGGADEALRSVTKPRRGGAE